MFVQLPALPFIYLKTPGKAGNGSNFLNGFPSFNPLTSSNLAFANHYLQCRFDFFRMARYIAGRGRNIYIFFFFFELKKNVSVMN